MRESHNVGYYDRAVNWENFSSRGSWSNTRLPNPPGEPERSEIELYDRLTKAADAAKWAKCPKASEVLKREAGGVLDGLVSRHIIPPTPEVRWTGLIDVPALKREAVSMVLDCADIAGKLGRYELRERLHDLIEPDPHRAPVAAPEPKVVVAPVVPETEEPLAEPSVEKVSLLTRLGSLIRRCGRALMGLARDLFGR